MRTKKMLSGKRVTFYDGPNTGEVHAKHEDAEGVQGWGRDDASALADLVAELRELTQSISDELTDGGAHAAVMAHVMAQDADKLDEADLDEAVHDAASVKATNANNGGYEAQVAFLLSCGWNAADIIKRIDDDQA